MELVTDELGRYLLIEKLKLPYTKITSALDTLGDFHPDLWALGKVLTYSMQESPFIHVDGDVYIFRKFEDRVEQAPIIAQNLEPDRGIYSDTLNHVRSKFNFVPESLNKLPLKDLQALNAGVFGGNDIETIRRYSQTAFDFVNRNAKTNTQVNLGKFNCVYEQLLLLAIADESNVDIEFIFPGAKDNPDCLGSFWQVPDKTTYIHLLGGLKLQHYYFRTMEMILKRDYPEYHQRVHELISVYEL